MSQVTCYKLLHVCILLTVNRNNKYGTEPIAWVDKSLDVVVLVRSMRIVNISNQYQMSLNYILIKIDDVQWIFYSFYDIQDV